MKNTWNITATESGERLDVFLATKLPELTRSAIAKSLKTGAGFVNDKQATVHRFLKDGDVVSFEPSRSVAKIRKQPAGRTIEKHVHIPAIEIIAETSDWIVINKPAGLLVHPDREHPHGTLVDWLIAHTPSIAKVGEDPSRPGIMHRLDKEVSGLMVIAKTQSAFEHLKKQFASHTVDKRYLALVHGAIPKDEGDIKFRIARSKSQARMAARPVHEKEGQAAWTHYNVVERFTGATLCQLAILSGRTHQIRAHLHGLGYPVMGDPLYVLKQTKRNLRVPRLMLQSIHLAFKDPTSGESRVFDLTRDPAFDRVIDTFSHS